MRLRHLVVLALTAACAAPRRAAAPSAAPARPADTRDEGTRRMAERLARLADNVPPENFFVNSPRAERLRARLAAEGPSDALRLQLAQELLNAGKTEEAIAE